MNNDIVIDEEIKVIEPPAAIHYKPEPVKMTPPREPKTREATEVPSAPLEEEIKTSNYVNS